MYFVTLSFSQNRGVAPDHMAAHKVWIQRGFDNGHFLMVGSLLPNLGGGILAHNIDRDALEDFVAEDPFVKEGVVAAEILEISPARLDPRLEFLAA